MIDEEQKQDRCGEIGPIENYRMKENGLFHSNQELDYSIVELQGHPGERWGFIPLQVNSLVNKGARVNIIQHPGGRHKQISFRNNYVEYVDERLVQYVTHTEPGSSGSPVLNDQWELVALHHAGSETLVEPKTQRRYFRNEGIAIRAIIESLPQNIRDLLNPTQ